ncbi:hypothetical protein QTP88_026569 [Uroleucon formosanum]
MPKRKCVFTDKLKEEYKFLKHCQNKFAMCLPGTSAPSERIFSMMGFILRAERGRLSMTVLKELLNIKANSDLSCSQFHDKIKIDNCFLKKIDAFEKYEENKDDEEYCESGPSTN